MRFFLASCLTALYLYAYYVNISNISVVIISSLILFLFFCFLKKRNRSTISIIIELMCYCIPISWRNIFGGSFKDIPLPWFYILGGILIVCIWFKSFYKKTISGYDRLVAGIVTLILTFLGIIPLIITPRDFFNEGIGQFITLSFYNIILFSSIVKGPLINCDEVNQVREAYFLSGFITSLGVIFQFLVHRIIGITIGNILYALNRVIYSFMFLDISSGTLYLASTAFMMIIFADKSRSRKMFLYLSAILTIVATAITSARTGIVAFLITICLYSVSKKGIFKKFTGILLVGFSLFASLYFLGIVRPMSTAFDYFLNSSGRIEGYLLALEIFIKNLFLGTGFSRTYTSFLMEGLPVPHLSILQYLVQTGIIYTGMIFGVILYAQILSIKRSFIEGWVLLLTIIGSCFIPDIFSSRFIIIILITIFIQKTSHKVAT